MSFDDGFLLGLSLRSKRGGSDEWTPPAHWIDIPEPEANQVVMLVEITDTYVGVPACSIQRQAIDGEWRSCTIDWGDGYSSEIREGYTDCVGHIYTASGFYIVTVTCDIAEESMTSVYLSSTTINRLCVNGQTIDTSGTTAHLHVVRAVKFGADIQPAYSGLAPFTVSGTNDGYKGTLVYVKFCGKVMGSLYLESLYALKKVDFAQGLDADATQYIADCIALENLSISGLTTIGSGDFYKNYALKRAEFPDLVTMEGAAFNSCYNLETFIAPKLSSIAANSFAQCYSLKNVTVEGDFAYLYPFHPQINKF